MSRKSFILGCCGGLFVLAGLREVCILDRLVVTIISLLLEGLEVVSFPEREFFKLEK